MRVQALTGHCVELLGKTLNSRSASHHPGVLMCTGEFNAGGNPAMDSASQPGGSRNPGCFMLQKPNAGLTFTLFISCRAHQEKTPRMALHKAIACQAIHPLEHQPSRLTALARRQSHRLHQQAHQVQLSSKLVSLTLQSFSTIVIA